MNRYIGPLVEHLKTNGVLGLNSLFILKGLDVFTREELNRSQSNSLLSGFQILINWDPAQVLQNSKSVKYLIDHGLEYLVPEKYLDEYVSPVVRNLQLEGTTELPWILSSLKKRHLKKWLIIDASFAYYLGFSNLSSELASWIVASLGPVAALDRRMLALSACLTILKQLENQDVLDQFVHQLSTHGFFKLVYNLLIHAEFASGVTVYEANGASHCFEIDKCLKLETRYMSLLHIPNENDDLFVDTEEIKNKDNCWSHSNHSKFSHLITSTEISSSVSFSDQLHSLTRQDSTGTLLKVYSNPSCSILLREIDQSSGVVDFKQASTVWIKCEGNVEAIASSVEPIDLKVIHYKALQRVQEPQYLWELILTLCKRNDDTHASKMVNLIQRRAKAPLVSIESYFLLRSSLFLLSDDLLDDSEEISLVESVFTDIYKSLFGAQRVSGDHILECPLNALSSDIMDNSKWSEIWCQNVVELILQDFQTLEIGCLENKRLLFQLVVQGRDIESGFIHTLPGSISRCEDEFTVLIWLEDFFDAFWFYKSLRDESLCQSHLETLIRLATKPARFGMNTQIIALGTLHYGLTHDSASYVFNSDTVESLILLIHSHGSNSLVSLLALDILEKALRRTSLNLNDDQVLLLSQNEGHPFESTGDINEWSISLYSCILWTSCCSSEQFISANSSFVWSILQQDILSTEPVFLSRIVEHLLRNLSYVPSEIIESFLEDPDLFAFVATKSISTPAVTLFTTSDVTELIAAMYLSVPGCINDIPLRKLIISSDVGLLTLLDFFAAANAAPILRSLMQEYIPAVLGAFWRENSIEKEYSRNLLQLLLPFAAASHIHGNVNSLPEILDRLPPTDLLNLDNGCISNEDALNLPPLFKQFSSVNLSVNCLGNNGVITIGQYLTDPSCAIVILNLSRNSIGSLGLKSISEALRCNTIMIELNLCGNNLTDDDFNTTGIIALAESIIWNTTLKVLDLSCNVLTVPGVQHLSRALRYNGSLLNFNLHLTGASDAQICAVQSKVQLNAEGITPSPHLGINRKLGAVDRERAKSALQMLSGGASTPKKFNKVSSALDQFTHKKPSLVKTSDENDDTRQVNKKYSDLQFELDSLNKEIDDLRKREAL